MQNRKQTAWRKSRKFGDIHGGRMRRRMTDNIFTRCHSLKPPGLGEPTPIVLRDNPSRDYFFPLAPDECLKVLRGLPNHAADDLTHLWFRRIRSSARGTGSRPLAQFICGSRVRVIVLYPWRRDLRHYLDKEKPRGAFCNKMSRYAGEPQRDDRGWFFQFEASELRRYYLEQLLLHEVGHHVDWYSRHWSKANTRAIESAADSYAVEWTASGAFEAILDEEV